MSRAAFICSSELWARGHGPEHPLKPERLKRTYELLQAYGAFDGDGFLVPPRLATKEELCLFHTSEYVAAVESLSRGEDRFNPARYNFGPGDNPVFPGMYETEALKVGAALVAMEIVLSGEADDEMSRLVRRRNSSISRRDISSKVAFSFSGGLHHAGPASASGFCVFNDAAVLIHALLRRGLRVAYIDIDVHHGDGVQWAFYESDQVLTISLHESGLYLFPGTGFTGEIGEGPGRGYSANLPLAPFTDDEVYLWAFREIVPPLVEAFGPDIVVSQLGTDTHYLDPLAHLCLTTRGYEAVVREIKALAPRWIALGGGGYALDVVPRAWTLAYGVMLGRDFPDELPSAYARKYGPGRLRDRGGPHLDEGLREEARRYAQRGVEELKGTVLRILREKRRKE